MSARPLPGELRHTGIGFATYWHIHCPGIAAPAGWNKASTGPSRLGASHSSLRQPIFSTIGHVIAGACHVEGMFGCCPQGPVGQWREAGVNTA